MQTYEYKVIPAPSKGRKAPGLKKPEDRFSRTLEELMNEMAVEGWEYQRADVLPSEERQGLTSSHTVYRSVLVFRRGVIGEEIKENALENPTGDPEIKGEKSDSYDEELTSDNPKSEGDDTTKSGN